MVCPSMRSGVTSDCCMAGSQPEQPQPECIARQGRRSELSLCSSVAANGIVLVDPLQEVALCADLLLERPQDWQTMGRDFVRVLTASLGSASRLQSGVGVSCRQVLQHVAKVPQFLPVWRRLRSPASGQGEQSLLEQMLAKPTDPVFLRARLTPQMESQLMYRLAVKSSPKA
jgi:hypothetical protein